jgi:small subunit ribosomal protein S18
MNPRFRKKKPRRSMETPRMRGVTCKAEDLDYKNTPLLQRLTSAQGKMFSRKRTGLNAEFQRKAALALKRARFMALMPFVS